MGFKGSLGKIFGLRSNGSLIEGFNGTLHLLLNGGPSIADLENDGSKEIIIAAFPCSEDNSCGIFGTGTGGELTVLDSSGNVKSGWPVNPTPELEGFIGFPVISDLDDDGKKEIIVGSYEMGRYLIPRIFSFYLNGSIVPGWPVSCGTGFESIVGNNRISLGDINKDGQEDIIAYNGRFICAFDSSGNKIISDITIEEEIYDSITLTQPLVADVNDDNLAEIIAVYKDKAYIKDNFGNDLEGWPKVIPGVFGVPLLEDLNNDGTKEIIFHTMYGNIYSYSFSQMGDMDWPKFQHDNKRTGCYDCVSIQSRPQSKAVNLGSSSINGTLIIKLQKKNGESFVDYGSSYAEEVVIPANSLIKLDVRWNNLGYSIGEPGRYKVYAEFLNKSSSYNFVVA
jgi:hypothetical protein